MWDGQVWVPLPFDTRPLLPGKYSWASGGLSFDARPLLPGKHSWTSGGLSALPLDVLPCLPRLVRFLTSWSPSPTGTSRNPGQEGRCGRVRGSRNPVRPGVPSDSGLRVWSRRVRDPTPQLGLGPGSTVLVVRYPVRTPATSRPRSGLREERWTVYPLHSEPLGCNVSPGVQYVHCLTKLTERVRR